MAKQKKAKIWFSIIIVILVAFIGGIEYYHYQQTKVANEMQRSINKQYNVANRATVTVPPCNISILCYKVVLENKSKTS